MDLKNKAELEKYFADHFDTVLFPILADIYKNEGDIVRAKKVCEIGLEYHPANVDGSFILSEIYQSDGDLTTAEKLLKNIIAIEPQHYQAAINLAKIQLNLKRSPDVISKLLRKIAIINPVHPSTKAILKKPSKKAPTPILKEEISQPKNIEPAKSDVDKLKQKLETNAQAEKEPEKIVQQLDQEKDKILAPKPPSIKPQKISEEELQSLDISPRMATFTMVNVLKRQKLYQQALSVLKMLEEKGADAALIAQERDNLQQLVIKNENK